MPCPSPLGYYKASSAHQCTNSCIYFNEFCAAIYNCDYLREREINIRVNGNTYRINQVLKEKDANVASNADSEMVFMKCKYNLNINKSDTLIFIINRNIYACIYGCIINICIKATTNFLCLFMSDYIYDDIYIKLL